MAYDPCGNFGFSHFSNFSSRLLLGNLIGRPDCKEPVRHNEEIQNEARYQGWHENLSTE
jgi:hypothetical protein